MWAEKTTGTVNVFVASHRGLAVGLVIVVGWLLLGIPLGFPQKWQSIFDTTLNVITFILALLIQRNQHKNEIAIHLKLDELVKGVDKSRNNIAGIEKLEEETLETMDHCK